MNRKYLWTRPGIGVRLYAGMLALLLLAVGLSSCESAMQLIPPLPTKTPFVLTELPPGAREISFENVLQGYVSRYEGSEPRLIVIATPSQAQEMDQTLYPIGPPSLTMTNFDDYFVIIAFYGYRGMGGPQIEIKQIVRREHQVDVYAYLTDVPRGWPRPAQAVSPFHAVRVRKEGDWGGEFAFVLYDNDRPVAETKHYIP